MAAKDWGAQGWRALECSSNYGAKLTSARGSTQLIMKTFNLSSSVIQHENHSASRPGDLVFLCLSTFSIIREHCDVMRCDTMRCPTPRLRILSRNRSGGKLEKAKGEKAKHLSGNWQRGRFQVECIIHLFLLHGLLVVINETSSSGPAPILVRIGGSFRPGAQSFPLQVVKDYGQGPSSSFVAGQPRRGTWPSPHPKNPTPFSRSVRVCVCFGHFGHYVAPTFSALRPSLNERRPRLAFDLTLRF